MQERFIQGEVDALEKIVFNYLSNALKFTPAGGEIRLELHTQAGQLRLRRRDRLAGRRVHAPDQRRERRLRCERWCLRRAVDARPLRQALGRRAELRLLLQRHELPQPRGLAGECDGQLRLQRRGPSARRLRRAEPGLRRQRRAGYVCAAPHSPFESSTPLRGTTFGRENE